MLKVRAMRSAHKRRYKRLNPQRIQEEKRRARLRRYGLTVAEYDSMFAAQDGKCAICDRANDRRLCVDHDHETGAVRELLCDPCNQGLGRFGDDPDLMLKAIAYLRKHHQQRLKVIK
jgi:hypothetical protein